MPSTEGLTARVFTVFAQEVAAHGGRVTETLNDGQRLFTRSILPHVADVRPRDRVQGGVALKATGADVWLYPYLFRLVCKNGAIIAQTLDTRPLTDLHLLKPDAALCVVRESVQACCAGEVFTNVVRKMRTACESRADFNLNLLPLLSQLSRHGDAKLLRKVIDMLFREGDISRFGIANAITATARDTADPDLKWNLEEFGGAVAIGTVPLDPAGGGQVATPWLERLVTVG